MRDGGRRVIVEPAPPRSLLGALARFESLDDGFPLIAELPRTPVEL